MTVFLCMSGLHPVAQRMTSGEYSSEITGSPQSIAGEQSRNLDSDGDNEDLLKRGRFGEEYGDLINRVGTTRSNEQERASGKSGDDALSIGKGKGRDV